MSALLRVRWLGRMPYAEAWDLQRAIWHGRVQGRGDDYLLLVEHPHVYTVGRNGDGSNLLVPSEALGDLGAELFNVDRGGDITYHGPGQLVGYPIIRLPDPKQIVPYVRRLELTLIETLSAWGVHAWSEPGLTGVWTEQGKVAAIGVRVARQVTMHGFALNLSPDMAYFGRMNPCGITERPVASLSQLLGRKISIEEAAEVLIGCFESNFGYSRAEVQLGAFARGHGRQQEFEVDRLLAAGTFSPDRKRSEPI
ncbi:MAG TPA: lipoyl(octanoyl) transferase LipB, partial [Acidimicrobiia bacterium]|nr:lipoyl(octanoyl) transferase LipB [Acidimicrobiia bacterium]